MENLKRLMTQQKVVLPVFLTTVIILCCVVCKIQAGTKHNEDITRSEKTQWIKGYDLPVGDKKKDKVKTECLEVADSISHIYKNADKGTDSNAVLSHETLEQMQKTIAKTGYSVVTSEVYCDMYHYQKVDLFLKDCMNGIENSVVLYSLSDSGSFSRKEYIFDGSDMYLLSAGVDWNDSSEPVVSYVLYTRIHMWNYTEKGWFAYELCVPEPPEVTEIINGIELIRVIPLPDEYKTLSEKYVYPLCYTGNNILCSNWDTDNLAGIDYNSVFEFFYRMKYGKRLDSSKYVNGIPAAEFEDVIMEYLPVTAEEIREWAEYDEKTQTYARANLECSNYNRSRFGTALPEVTGVKENPDGTTTLTVEAVSDMVVEDDKFITHELTIRFEEDGSFRYLGNKILDDE